MWAAVQIWGHFNTVLSSGLDSSLVKTDVLFIWPPASPAQQSPAQPTSHQFFISKLNTKREFAWRVVWVERYKVWLVCHAVSLLSSLEFRIFISFFDSLIHSLGWMLGITVKYICLRKEWCKHTAVKYGVQNKYCIENSNQIQSLDLHF